MKNELPVPAAVERGEEADEVLRVWIVDGELYAEVAGGAFPDGAEWGRLLFDLAQEIAEGAAVSLGTEAPDVFDEVLSAFLEEMDQPEEEEEEEEGGES